MIEAVAVKHDQGYCFECCSAPNSRHQVENSVMFQDLEPGKLTEEFEIHHDA